MKRQNGYSEKEKEKEKNDFEKHQTRFYQNPAIIYDNSLARKNHQNLREQCERWKNSEKTDGDLILQKYHSDADRRSIDLITRFFKKKIEGGATVSLAWKKLPRRDYPDGVLDYLNGGHVFRSYNLKNINQLVAAVNNGDWNDLIFQHENIQLYATTAVTQSKISIETTTTIHMWINLKKSLPQEKNVEIIPLLDDNENWTEWVKLKFNYKGGYLKEIESILKNQLESVCNQTFTI